MSLTKYVGLKVLNLEIMCIKLIILSEVSVLLKKGGIHWELCSVSII